MAGSAGSAGIDTAGAGGGAGVGGGPGGGPGGSAGAAAVVSRSVLQRGHDLFRQATYVEPTLTRAAAAAMAPDTAFDAAATFSGNIQASVLFLENGPISAGCPAAAQGCLATGRASGAGLLFATTQLNGVYAIDEATGLTVWHAPLESSRAGDGVRGTPVIDPMSRVLIVVVGAGDHHEVHALSVDDGSERPGWPVILSSTTLSHGATPFNAVDQNQHGALLLLGNTVYVPFGGHAGDGGNYRGWIVAIDITNPGHFAGWATAGVAEGIWAHGGLTSDGTGVFAVTGNGHAATHDGSSDAEEVVRLTGMATLDRTAANVYYPAAWQAMDATDRDFGSSTPSYVPLPKGSSPAALLIAPAKPGHLYILDGTNLSSGRYPEAGGELADLIVADTASESIYTSPTVYRSTSGIHAAINVSYRPAGCPKPIASDHAIISILLQPGQSPIATEVWCAAVGVNTGPNGPPISTSSDGGDANPLVWFMNGPQLSAVDGDTGAFVVTTSGPACATPNMSFPIAVKGRIVVATDGKLCSWSPAASM
jgi:hypothetical protein